MLTFQCNMKKSVWVCAHVCMCVREQVRVRVRVLHARCVSVCDTSKSKEEGKKTKAGQSIRTHVCVHVLRVCVCARACLLRLCMFMCMCVCDASKSKEKGKKMKARSSIRTHARPNTQNNRAFKISNSKHKKEGNKF